MRLIAACIGTWLLVVSVALAQQKNPVDGQHKTLLLKKKLLGKWRVVKPANADLALLTFDERKITLAFHSIGKRDYGYQVTMPRGLDFFDGEQALSLAIFDLTSDTLRICVGKWQGKRPERFFEDKNVVLLELVRAKN